MVNKGFDNTRFDATSGLSGAPSQGDQPRAEKRPTAISLFSGGGGLDIGIERAGFKTLCCIEIDPNCCETLRYNQAKFITHARIIESDVRKISPSKLMGELSMVSGELDMLYGGPPCQTFSQIGKQDSLSDDRGLLLFEMVRFARVFRPKVVVTENVKALLNAKDLKGIRGGVVKKLVADLRKLGYELHVKVINSADFGVAQLRERVFIIATQENIHFDFPRATHGPGATYPYATVGDALKGLRRPKGKSRRDVEDGHVDVTPDGDKLRIHYVAEGSYLAASDAPRKIKGRLTRKDTTKFLRLAKKGLSKTLRCGEIFFHPTQDRYLTPREYMRLHSFPDNYFLRGPIRGRSGSVRNLDQHRQVANSVPPQVAEMIGRQIFSAIREAQFDG